MNTRVKVPELVYVNIIIMVLITLYVRGTFSQISIGSIPLFVDGCIFTPVRYLASTVEYDLGYWLSPFCYSFVHYDWSHLFFNAIFFLIFATSLVRRTGNIKAVLFFLFAAFFSAMVTLLPIIDRYVYLIGYSGVVSACLGAVLRLGIFPGKLEPAPAPFNDKRTCYIFLVVWLLLNGLPIITPFMEADIAWQSHLAGFTFGFLFYPLFETRISRDFTVQKYPEF